MTLALTLDAEKHSALDSALQPLYVKQDDGNYRLDADIPDNSGLKAKADELLGETKRERELRKAAEERAKALEDERQKALEDNARAKGDVESLEKSYQEKMQKLETDYSGKVSTLEKQIYSLTVGKTANDIANELAIKGSASVMLPHIERHITSERDENGNLRTWFLDENGNKTSETKDEFMARFRNNAAFKPLIAANGASGSGANGANGGAGNKQDPQSMSALERKQLKDSDPAAFARLFPS